MLEDMVFYSWVLGAFGWAGYCLFRAGMEDSGLWGNRDSWILATVAAPVWFLAWPARFLVKLGEQYRENRSRHR